MIRHESDCAVPRDMHLLKDADDGNEDKLCSTIELTCKHSANTLREFDRIRKQYPSTEYPGTPELSFLYDTRVHRKNQYKPIFAVYGVDYDDVVKDPVGEYYKNVSKEWATIVKGFLPGYLAFTRSIGDFYWKEYGVTEHPEIQSFDLREIAQEDDVICIAAVSDGVSDNWLCELVGKFVMDPNCLNAVLTQPDVGAQRVARSFIGRNKIYGKRHFGDDTDNATANIAYIKLNGVFADNASTTNAETNVFMK